VTPQVYPAEVIRVYDGDTPTLDLALPEQTVIHPLAAPGVLGRLVVTTRIYLVAAVRMMRMRAPELRRAGGSEAVAYARSLLPLGLRVVATTWGVEKYGRTLADITLPDGRDFAAEMIRAGHAVPYDGRGPGTG
jgi:endonuclease YncB( thermonuclease family)